MAPHVRQLLGVMGATLVVALLLARPATVVACTGCPIPLSYVVHGASALFVASSDGQIADRTYRLAVSRVLKGEVPRLVTYHAVPSQPAMPQGSRWIIVIDPVDQAALRTSVLSGRWDSAWFVSSDGRIELPGMVTAPATLPAFLAWFGLPATDAEPVSTESAPPIAAFLVLAGIALAFLALELRLRRGAPDRALDLR